MSNKKEKAAEEKKNNYLKKINFINEEIEKQNVKIEDYKNLKRILEKQEKEIDQLLINVKRRYSDASLCVIRGLEREKENEIMLLIQIQKSQQELISKVREKIENFLEEKEYMQKEILRFEEEIKHLKSKTGEN